MYITIIDLSLCKTSVFTTGSAQLPTEHILFERSTTILWNKRQRVHLIFISLVSMRKDYKGLAWLRFRAS